MNFYAFTALFALIALFIISVVTYYKSKNNPATISFATFNGFIALWVLGCFLESTASNPTVASIADKILYTGAVFAPVMYLRLIFAFIKESVINKILLYIGYLLSLTFLAFNIIPFLRPIFISNIEYLSGFRYISVPSIGWYLYFIYYNAYGSITLLTIFLSFRNSIGLKREQLKYLFIATALLASGGVLYFSLVFRLIQLPIDNFFTISYAIVTSYAIIKYRLMDIKIAFTKAGLFLVVYALVLGVPFYVYSFYPGYLSIVLMFVFATVGPLGYRYLNRKAEMILLAEQRRYHKILMQASEGMVKQHDLDKLLKLTVHIISRSVKVQYAAAFLIDKENKCYRLQAIRHRGIPYEPMIFDFDSPFIQYLQQASLPLSFQELPEPVQKSIKYNLDIQLIVPSFAQDKLLGFLLLGEKLNKTFYSSDDINVFKALSNQAALAIESCFFMHDFQAAQERLFQAEKLASIGGMADGLAHQIKNRLNLFSVGAGEIKNEVEYYAADHPALFEKFPDIKESFSYVVDAADKMVNNVKKTTSIIQGILNFARIEEKDTAFCEFSLQEVIDSAKDLLTVKHGSADLPITFVADKDVLYGVKAQIMESIFNILDNAFEATREKREYFLPPEQRNTYNAEIRVTLVDKGTVSIITIVDNGIGIKEENKRRIFAPFFTTKASAVSGSGIGMYVVKRMIEENHKGHISFSSTYGEGTRFTIELPNRYI